MNASLRSIEREGQNLHRTVNQVISAVPLSSNIPSHRVYWLRCPGGQSFQVRGSDIKRGTVLQKMKTNCERFPPYCSYNVNDGNLGCSSAFSQTLERDYRVRDACVIHDLCYLQYGDRDKQRCDRDFKQNFENIW